MRLFRPWSLSGCLYPDAIFRIKTTEKILYLTFDDGPDPDSTPQLLNILDSFDIKALFFCTGKSAEKHPHLISLILSKGHIIGNHGFSHLNGWNTPTDGYIADVEKAAACTSGIFFRPPYGSLRFSQYLKLKRKYKIVFWDLMPYDFDLSTGAGKSLEILKGKIRTGSIIVLHDTPRSAANTIIEEFIVFALNEGYRFDIKI
jgi:peptidoglycan-N-acetylglucosamine deacetylase